MTATQILVNLTGLALIILIVWYFWLYRREGVQVTEVGGVQDVQVRVKGGYDPDVIVVKQGKLVRLHRPPGRPNRISYQGSTAPRRPRGPE